MLHCSYIYRTSSIMQVFVYFSYEENSHNIAARAELLFLAQICTKSFVGWGFALDPTGRAHSTPPDPLAAMPYF